MTLTRRHQPHGCLTRFRCWIPVAVWGLFLSAGLSLQAQTLEFGDPWRWVDFTIESGLPGNSVQQVIEAADGTIWASTTEGLAWYDGYAWRAVGGGRGQLGSSAHIVADFQAGLLVTSGGRLFRGNTDGLAEWPLSIDGRPLRVLGAVPLDATTTLVVGQRSPATPAVLFAFDRDGAPADLPLPTDATALQVPAVWRTDRGTVWVANPAGLFFWSGQDWVPHRLARNSPQTLTHLVENGEGAGLAFYRNPERDLGLWEWDPGEGPRHTIAEGLNLAISLAIDSAGDAVALYETGQARIRSDGRWRSVDPLPSRFRTARAVLFQRNGDLWLASGNGLSVYRRSRDRFVHWRYPFPDLHNRTSEILRTRAGDVWIGTSAGLIVRRADGTTETITHVEGEPLGLVTALAEDRNGNLWVGSGGSFTGAWQWDGRSWRHVGAAEGLHAQRVHRIHSDRRGDLWFLGIGMTVSEPQPGAFRLIDGRFEHWGIEEGLPNARMYAFAESPDGTRWFGTRAGLSRWRDGQWTHWGPNEGTFAPGVFTLAVDETGHLWFGDRVAGLGYVDALDRIARFRVEDGMPDNSVWDLDLDPDGTLWITTQGGLASLRDGKFSRFGADIGLSSDFLWPVLATAGAVYIGTNGRGVDVLNRSVDDRVPPRVSIDMPHVDGNSVHVSWQANAYQGSVSSDLIETRFRIDDDAWSAWSRARETTMVALSPGRHTLSVQAAGLFGDLSAATTAPFVIPAPVFLRPIVAIPFATLAVSILGLIAVARRRRAAELRVVRRGAERYRRFISETSEGICRFEIEPPLAAETPWTRQVADLLNHARVAETNDALARMHGFTSGHDLIGRAPADFMAGDPAQLEDLFAEFVAQGYRVTDARTSRPGHAGHRQHFLVSLIGIVENGRCVRAWNYTRDVTEMVTADAARQESEELFAKAFRASADAVTVSRRADGQFLDVNDGFVRISGYTREETIGTTSLALELWPSPQSRRDFAAALDTHGTVRGLIVPFRIKSGEIRICEVSADIAQIRDEPCLVAVTRDVTERRRAEDALRESEERFATAYRASPNSITISDAETGKLIDVNAAFTSMTGYERDEVIGRTVASLGLVNADEFLTVRDRNVREGFVRDVEASIRTKSGEDRVVELSMGLIEIGGRQCNLVVAVDVTDRKRAEAALTASRDRLRDLAQRVQRAREEESARISREIHDELGGALTGLKMDLSWLAGRESLDPHTIRERTSAMATLVDETIHTVRRISAELRPSLLDDLGLSAAIEWLAQEFSRRTGVLVELHLDPLEGGGEEADTAVYRILQEALTNVARHAAATTVTIRTEIADDEIRVDMADNGCGFDADQTPGPLSIGILGMRERAKACGGRVTVMPRPEGGTVVQVRIPLTRVLTGAGS